MSVNRGRPDVTDGPPARNPRTRRHTAQTMLTARRMYKGQWTVPEITRYLSEHHVPITENTIRRWVIPGWGAAHRPPSQPVRKRRARGIDTRILELRSVGLSFGAIQKLIDHEFGLVFTDEQIRWRYRKATS